MGYEPRLEDDIALGLDEEEDEGVGFWLTSFSSTRLEVRSTFFGFKFGFPPMFPPLALAFLMISFLMTIPNKLLSFYQ